MAAIETRRLVDGSTNHVVRWVVGGGRRRAGAQNQSATFEHYNDAIRFKLDVEDVGHHWPEGWTKDQYGYAIRKPAEPERQYTTVEQVAREYIAAKYRQARSGAIEYYTVERYEAAYDKHLDPTFGERDFTQVTVEDVEDWIVSQYEVPLAGKTILNQLTVLSPIFKYGIHRMRLRGDNPCDAIMNKPTKGTGLSKDIRFFLHEEWALLRAQLNPDVHLLVDLKLATGMRWQEISALRCGDCHRNEDGSVSIHIQRAWSKRGKNNHRTADAAAWENAKWIIKTTKSRREHWVHVQGDVAEELLQDIEGRAPDGYVFTTRSGIPWRYEDFLTDRWNPARKAAAKQGLTRIDPTPHMLRHSFVVWSLHGGEPIEKVSAAIGHASIQVTMDVYGGFIDPKRSTVSATMADQIAQARKLLPVRLHAATPRRARNIGADDGNGSSDRLLAALDDGIEMVG